MKVICCLQDTQFKSKDTYRLKMKRWKKIFQANGNKKQLGQQYFDTGDCKTKTKKDITKNKGKCYLLFGCYLKKNQLLAINQFNISQSDTGI